MIFSLGESLSKCLYARICVLTLARTHTTGQPNTLSHFQMCPLISVRGSVRPSVSPLVRPSVCTSCTCFRKKQGKSIFLTDETQGRLRNGQGIFQNASYDLYKTSVCWSVGHCHDLQKFQENRPFSNLEKAKESML